MLGSLTIKAKITLMAVAAVLSLGVFFLIAELAARNVTAATAAGESVRGDIQILAEMQLTNLDLLLNAMDTIVDKDAGSVDPDRIKAMNGAIDFLTDNADVFARMAESTGKLSLARGFKDTIEILDKSATQDLVRAVETKAGEDTFARLDDEIDGTGGEISEVLNTLNAAGQAELSAALENAGEAVATSEAQSIVTFIVALAILIPLMFVSARSILSALAGVTGVMQRLAGGDMSVSVPDSGQDEIGHMIRAVQVFKDNAVERARLAENESKQRAKKIEALVSKFEGDSRTVLDELLKAADALDKTASAMTQIASTTSQRSSAMASAAEQASANVQTVAAAAEELSVSISGIRQNARTASDTVSTAVAQANDTNTTVQGMSDAAQKIGKVVELIAEIANQTNLLALNATIEAARAGEAGKGFAVVASEVKNLANQTAKATEDIALQVDGIQKTSGSAVSAIANISQTISQVNSVASNIAQAIEEQASATQEISRNVQQASAGTSEVTESVRLVSDGASETGRAADSVLHAATTLQGHVTRLREGVGQFLQGIRAA